MENYLGRNCEIYGDLKNCCIGDNVYIGSNSKLNSTIVYDNAKIEDSTVLNNCVVGENCKISSHSNLKDSVFGDNETIADDSIMDKEVVWTQPVPEGYPKKQIGNVIGE